MADKPASLKMAGYAGVWVAAVLVATALGSIIQTQFNMAAIHALGAPVPATTWLAVTLRDLIGFGSFYVAGVAVAFLFALPAAALVSRIAPARRTLIFALAGGVGVGVFLQLLPLFLPAADLRIIGATRYVSGTMLMIVAGIVGGWVYARLTPSRVD